MTTTEILLRLAEFAPPIIAETTKPGPHCVLSSRVGQLVLERLGVPAEPYVAEVLICNAAWVEWSKEEFAGGSEAQIARGAWLLTNRPKWDGPSLPSLNPPTGPSWDGHLALRSGGMLIDLDLGAFTRPTKDIWLPPAMVAPLGADNTVEGEYHADQHVTYVRYAPLVAPYADEYLTSKDWVLADRYEDRVAAIVELIQEDA